MKKKVLSIVLTLGLFVSTAALPVYAENTQDENVVFWADFENYELETRPIDIIGESSGTMIGDTILEEGVVVKDDGSGNKVLQLQNNTLSPANIVPTVVNFGNTYSEGIYEISYKIKLINHSARFFRLFNLGNENGDATRTQTSGGVYFYLNDEGGIHVVDNMNAMAEYCTVTQVIDFGAKNYYYLINGNFIGAYYPLLQDSIDRAKIELGWDPQTPAANGSLGVGQVGTYYIDDICVKRIQLSLDALSLENTAFVSCDTKAVTGTFSHDLKPDTVSSDTVKVYENDALMPAGSYTVSAAGRNLTVTFADKLKSLSKYKIVLNGVESGCYVPADFVMAEFTTEKIYNLITNLPIQNGDKYYEPYTLPEFVPEKETTVYNIRYTKNNETITLNTGDILMPGIYTAAITATDTSEEYETEEMTISFEILQFNGSVYNEDFEGFEINERPVSVIGEAGPNSGANVKVVDDGTGNKVLQLMADDDPLKPIYTNISFGDKYSDGVYEFSYKIKFVNHTTYMDELFSLKNDGVVVEENKTSSQYYLIGGKNWADIITQMDDAVNNYATVKQIVDFDNDMIQTYVNDHWYYTREDFTADAIDSAGFTYFMRTDDPGHNGTLGVAGTPGQYFIDDIKVVKVGVYELSKGLYNADGEKLSSLIDGAGKKVTAEILVRSSENSHGQNAYLTDGNVIVFTLFKNGVLEDVVVKEKSEISIGYVEATFDIPDDASGYKLNYMIFNSLEGLRPCIEKGVF